MNRTEVESLINNQNIKPSEFRCGYSESNTGSAKFKSFTSGEYGFRKGPCSDCTRKEFLSEDNFIQIYVLEPDKDSKDKRLIEASCSDLID